MKIALTFLTLSVVLLLGSLMWGMKNYTDFRNAEDDVADLKEELERYRSGTTTYPVAMPGVVAQAPAVASPASQQAPPTLNEDEIEARLEEMIASRLGEQEETKVNPAESIPSIEDELMAYENQSSAIDRERASLLAERQSIAPTPEPLLTEGQNKIATAPVLASVTEANSQYSFVVMNAGQNKNIEVGKVFSIRRNHMIIGEAKIDSVEQTEAVANVKPSSIPAGVVIKEGDQVVEFVGVTGS